MPEVSKVPVHSVVLSRDTGKKDAKGLPIFARLTPPIGKPFSFTQEEHDDIVKANPNALRDPKDESEMSDKIKAAADAAMKNAGALPMGGSAAGDAAMVAVTEAKGKKATRTAGTPGDGAAAGAHDPADDNDTL